MNLRNKIKNQITDKKKLNSFTFYCILFYYSLFYFIIFFFSFAIPTQHLIWVSRSPTIVYTYILGKRKDIWYSHYLRFLCFDVFFAFLFLKKIPNPYILWTETYLKFHFSVEVRFSFFMCTWFVKYFKLYFVCAIIHLFLHFLYLFNHVLQFIRFFFHFKYSTYKYCRIHHVFRGELQEFSFLIIW